MRKRSVAVLISLGACAAACRRTAADPCDPNSWADQGCQEAIRNGGYTSHGVWIPHAYPYPYSYYYGNYGRYVSDGGHSSSSSAHSGSDSGTVRGGFGSTGSGAGE